MARVPDKILKKYEEDTRYNVQFDDWEHQVTDQYSIRNPFGFYFEGEKMKYMVKLLNHEKLLLSDKSVLDIGCHYGFHLNQLAFMKGNSRDMVGIDIIEDYVETAKQLNPGMTFRTCQSLDDWPERRFNLISAIYVLSEIPAEGGYRKEFIYAISRRQESGDYLMVMNFRRMPKWAYKALGKTSSFLGRLAPSVAKKIEHISALSLERNLDDEAMAEQFADYEVVKSYSFMFFFGRDLYLKFKLPIGVIKFLEIICPIYKYYFVLLKKK